MVIKDSQRVICRTHRRLREELGEAAEFSLMAMTFVVAIVAGATTLAEAIDARIDTQGRKGLPHL